MADVTMAQPSLRCGTLKPGKMVVLDSTQTPGKSLLLAGILIGVLMHAVIPTGTLMLAGILTGILILAGTPESQEFNISDETPVSDGARTVSRRTQIRLREQYQRRNWRVYRRLR